MKLSLALIVAPTDDEAKKLNNCLASVSSHVDEICVTITGSNKKVEEIAEQYKAKVSHFEWVDDFAAARNFNFEQCTGDWILWLDADDILWGGEHIKKLIALADEHDINGLQMWYEYGHANDGTVIDSHWKTQLVKNDGSTFWKGRIHEDLLQRRACMWSQLPVDQVKRIHTAKSEETHTHHERNIRILEKVAAEEPDEPRTYIYLGRSYAATKQYEKALEALTTFVALSGWDEERYEAYCLIGECHEKLGDYKNALHAYHDAMLEDEHCPKAFIFKARIYVTLERYKDALQQLKLAQSFMNPKKGLIDLPTLFEKDALGLASICHLHLGNYEDASALAEILYSKWPKDRHMRELKNITGKMVEDERLTKTYIKLLDFYKKRDPSKISAIASTIPNDIKDDPRLSRRSVKPTVWGDKSIVIYCGQSTEDWLPGAENTKGIGGSETAIIELSKRLAKKGWEVTVYNSCNAPAGGVEVDGVMWRNSWEFVRNDTFNILWLWRMPVLLDYEWDAKKVILDMHDTSNKYEFTEKRINRVHKIFVKTQYHRSLYSNVPDEKFVIVGNGITFDRFKQKVERNPHKIIYSSTPNRGLENILDIWPKIRAHVPDAELHVFYGWNTYYALEKQNPTSMAWMEQMKRKMQQEGVVDHGRVGQEELAREMLSSALWLYPTQFPEIHCITACEMQAAGVFPMTTGFAALAETQKTGYTQIGDPTTDSWRKKFTEAVVHRLKEGADHEAIKTVAKDFSWDAVADVWDHELR